jgi:glycosyltransferase involved in cell wall biosynthesis
MPVFNAQADLERSLRSLAGQVAPGDVIVVDDGSTPAITVPADFPAQLLRLERNQGIVAALNAGLDHILQGHYGYIARLDAGDLCRPGRLAAQQAYLDANPACALLGGAAQVVDLAGKPLFLLPSPQADAAIRRRMCFNSAFIHPAVMMRVSALRDTGVYDKAYQYAEDYELFSRLLARHLAANLPDVLIDYEMNPGGISLSRRRQLLLARLRVQWRYRQPARPACWLGLMQTVLMLGLPNRLLLALKKMRGVA